MYSSVCLSHLLSFQDYLGYHFQFFTMIPYHLLSKMRPYEVEVHGVKVKVSVVADNDRLINEKISEFKKLNKKNVVGVDVKTTYNASLLLFCVEGHCLILARIKDAHKFEVWKLLSDQNTCFVGSNFEHMKHCSYSGKEIFEKVGGIGAELDRLAAMILKKPSLKGVYELAGEIHVKPVTGTCPNWDAKVFSERKRSSMQYMMFMLSILLGRSCCWGCFSFRTPISF